MCKFIIRLLIYYILCTCIIHMYLIIVYVKILSNLTFIKNWDTPIKYFIHYRTYMLYIQLILNNVLCPLCISYTTNIIVACKN